MYRQALGQQINMGKDNFFFFFCVGKLHDNLLKRIINLNLKILVVPK